MPISLPRDDRGMSAPLPRTILITGCSSGIGATCAAGMKARGWRVFATARKEDDVRRLAGEGFDAIRLDPHPGIRPMVFVPPEEVLPAFMSSVICLTWDERPEAIACARLRRS